MRVATVQTMTCPRCGAPVKGDFKYCPECACRLHPGAYVRERPAHTTAQGRIVLGLIAASLLAAGTFVGYRVFGDRHTASPTEAPRHAFLTIDDLQDVVSIPEGTAFWDPETVWTPPPDDEVDQRILDALPATSLATSAHDLATHPRRLGRWSRLVRIFYARTRDLMQEQVRHVRIRTRPFQMTRTEITRGQWAEFLRAVEQDPGTLLQQAWIRNLWRPDEETTAPWAVAYRSAWWYAVQARTRDRLAAAAPELVKPAFITTHDLARITPAQALKLLYPASWVRIDEGGAIYWVLEPGTEDLPVTDISWWDAQIFVAWASQRLGLMGLRLPNWAEWVRAYHGNHPAKPPDDFDDAGDPGWRWPWGNVLDPHGCNNLNHSWNDPLPTLRDVRRLYGWHDGDTADGVLSMAGNAAEWTRSWAGREQPATGDYVALNWSDEGTTPFAFAMGGSYLKGINDCSVDARMSLRKTERRIDVGFRLVFNPISGLGSDR